MGCHMIAEHAPNVTCIYTVLLRSHRFTFLFDVPSRVAVSLLAGPRDDEFAGRRFSFVRYTSICGIIPNSQAFEDAARAAGKIQADFDKAAAGGGGGLVF